MSKYIFATLAIGVSYNYKVRTLIDCVLTLTEGDLLVITDDVPDLMDHIQRNKLDESRITLIHLSDLTQQNVWYGERMFNFNLKFLPTKAAWDKGGYDLIIHADADAFMIGWDEDSIQRFIDMDEQGMFARFRNRPIEEGGISFLLEPKATALSIELANIKARMPIEVFMLFKPNCPEFAKFMEVWEMIVERCYGRGVNPFIEALEISYALSESKLPEHPILDYMGEYKFINMFRYLHHDKIMRII